jgi:hypothetical protein
MKEARKDGEEWKEKGKERLSKLVFLYVFVFKILNSVDSMF